MENGLKYKILICFKALIFFGLFTSSVIVSAQTKIFNQFTNEVQFSESLKNNWETEFDIGHTFISTPPENNNMFAANSQLYFRGWLHYHLNAKWKMSYFFSYYTNHSIPEIDQTYYHEIRSAFQGIYFIHKLGYTLQSRFRIEDRRIQNATKTYESFYRLRAQLKYTQPFNSKVFKKGVYYGFASEELMCKTQALLTGAEFFDRNAAHIGLGYCISKDTQVEFDYVNEFLPRPTGNVMNNIFTLNLKFNGLLANRREHAKEVREIHSLESAN
jgi:hypothetical protein